MRCPSGGASPLGLCRVAASGAACLPYRQPAADSDSQDNCLNEVQHGHWSHHIAEFLRVKRMSADVAEHARAWDRDHMTWTER